MWCGSGSRLDFTTSFVFFFEIFVVNNFFIFIVPPKGNGSDVQKESPSLSIVSEYVFYRTFVLIFLVFFFLQRAIWVVVIFLWEVILIEFRFPIFFLCFGVLIGRVFLFQVQLRGVC